MTETETARRIRTDRRRATVLAGILAVQALAAVFFVADVGQDLRWGGWTSHSALEAVVAMALIVGTGFGALHMRQILNRVHQAETAMSIASGELFDLIEARFADWGLTRSEADVALFTLKGLDVADIADARGSAQGTVRAQLTRVYAKAGVSGRGQLTSLFIEDLMTAPGFETAGSKPEARAPGPI
jgi:DNA-binding CsgD family transcriptional regulator